MKVYFGPASLEKIAKDRALYSWDYLVRANDEEGPEGGILAGVFEVSLPTKAECIAPALAMLARKETELRQELNKELAELSARRNELIMLEFQS